MARKQHGGVAPTALAGLSAQDTTITASENDNITIDPRGTGIFEIKGNQQINDSGDLRFADSDSSNYVAFKAASTVASNVTWTLPNADSAVSGYALVSDGAGILSFAPAGATITSDTSSNTDFLLYFADTTTGALVAAKQDSGLTYNPSTGLLTMGATRSDSIGVGTAASATTGEIRATNSITSFYSSDERLKENIKNISGALDKISQINGVEYDWTDDYISQKGGEDGYFVRKHDVGLIAQEVEKVLPEIVAENSEGYKAIKYERVVALLVEAVKELNMKVKG